MRLRIAAACLLLAGCGSQSNQQAPDNKQAEAGPQAGAAPAAGNGGLTIQPGEWEVTMAMQAAQPTGMPAGVTMPQIPPSTIRSCVTPEQVSRANASFLGGGNQAGFDCDYSGITIAGGRIQGTSTCRRPGMEVAATMDGSFTPTSYEINQQIRSTMHGRTMSSTNHLVGRRIGECAPGQASAAARGEGNDQGGR